DRVHEPGLRARVECRLRPRAELLHPALPWHRRNDQARTMTPLGRVGQRLVLTLPVVLCVVTLIFFVVRVLPGDPAQAALGENASGTAVEALRARLGLDAPLPIQYLRFL